jgi:NAD(P)-dependent dehydrogenase (short-subunit alcohol dehydrogenase family)
MDDSFGGRWILVTGASSGLGQAIAVALSRAGANVVLLGRDEVRLETTVRQLEGRPHRTALVDLAQVGSISEVVSGIARECGPLYGMCHAAGLVQTRPLAVTTAESVRTLMDVNFVAGLELARSICRRDAMLPEGGSLLFISSVYGRVGVAGQIGYAATKGAIAAAVRALAIELARRNIRVNSLSPGLVMTPMTEAAFSVLSSEQIERIRAAHPLGIGQPEDVARVAAFMLSPAARWITGVDVPVDGGYTAQ